MMTSAGYGVRGRSEGAVQADAEWTRIRMSLHALVYGTTMCESVDDGGPLHGCDADD